MSLEELKKEVRTVPDFPQKGIIFRDLTSVFQKAECMRFFEHTLTEQYKNLGITKVIGIESRGFIMGSTMACRLNAGFVPIRKKGKLPAETVQMSYTKEYGVDIIEMHKDALNENDVVLIHDDLLATGGTMKAAIDLVRKFGVKKIYVSFLVELDDLNGRKLLGDDVEIDSLIHY
ncbi:MAG: adenine phosphoribosyltransferase [Alphaproteobacteria bacterium]|nr:adenine phosphoribosyltransferase [Alphaproteobacteria bacterium]